MEVIRLLLEAGAPKDRESAEGFTALEVGCLRTWLAVLGSRLVVWFAGKCVLCFCHLVSCLVAIVLRLFACSVLSKQWILCNSVCANAQHPSVENRAAYALCTYMLLPTA